MAKGLAASTVNRTRTGLKAALALAASLDDRITNARAWRVGLATLPDANTPRGDVVLADAQVVDLIACARALDQQFGLFVAVLALGVRSSQAARLEVRDLQSDRLMMPTSAQRGAGAKVIKRCPVPIPAILADALAAEARGRPADAPLLMQKRWPALGLWDARGYQATRAVPGPQSPMPGTIPIGSRPKACATPPSCGCWRRYVLIRLVASLCDTSSAIIEHNYSAYIAHHADELARSALLDPPALRQP